MAVEDKKISDLTVATTPSGAELVEIVQGGVNKQTTLQDIADLGGGGSGIVESIVAGTNITVDDTDPANPIISASGGGGAVDSVNGQTGVVDLDSDYANGKAAVDTTGTAISFATPQIYGSVGTPETGNITIVTTGLVQGMTQLLIHNNGTEPTYGAEIQIISGTYMTGVVNYIMLMAVSSSLVLVTISQELA